jgi:uncharacterized protein (DUF305 family)
MMWGAEAPAMLAYIELGARMHEGMAKAVLEHGLDPEVRALAEGVIAAQEAEIAWMEDRLARDG